MRDFDYSDAADFLAAFFGETTEHAVEIRALPNEQGGGPARSLFTRDGELVQAHCARWDGPGRAVYFGVATRIAGAPSGTRANLAELPALWADIDTDKLGLDKEEIVRIVKQMPLPPAVIADSGGGIHCYWLLREALNVRLDAPDSAETEAAVVAALKRLAGVMAGDPAVCDLARVMRLPGTHNTKTGELRPARIIEASWVQHEFDDIADMLDWLRPLVRAPQRPDDAPAAVDTNPFLEAAKRFGIKPPVDVERRLAAMSYLAAGDAGIHQTQLHVSAALAAQGMPDAEIVELLLGATKTAAGLDGAMWNWKREERNIARMVATAREKFAPPPAAAPVRQLRPTEQAEQNDAAPVVNLADERRARQERKPRADDDKNPLIARIGDAVIDWWRDNRGQIAVIDGQPYTYRAGLWAAWDTGDHHALKTAIQGVVAAIKIEPKTQLLNAVSRYVIERPELMREGVEWDASGYIVCRDGAIDPLSRETVPHSPDHWATAGAEVDIADMGAGCPQWLAFLDSCFSDVGEAERTAIVASLAEWFGAALVRQKPRELRKALWLYGESRTGKTRIAEVFRLLIGEPTCSLKLRALEKNFGGSALIGKRAWIADDAIGSADEIDDALFKVIVTGEAFSTDVKNAAHQTLRLTLPVLFTSNPLPRVKDQSDAVFNRALLIHMRVVRTEEETAGQTPIEEVVRDGELAGVFAWALDGWARLSKRGRFLPPASMLEAAAEFKAANNVVGSWARESLELATEYMIDRRDAYASFKGWYAAEYGEAAKVPSPKFMMGSLRQSMPIGSDHKSNGNRFITKVRLTADGLAYRKESGHEAGIAPGSGCPESEVNKSRPYQDSDPPTAPPYRQATGKEPRF